jgi:hypothetical protein
MNTILYDIGKMVNEKGILYAFFVHDPSFAARHGNKPEQGYE